MKAALVLGSSRIAQAAFTLVELLLATALLLLLFAAVAVNFSAAQTGSELLAGTERFETLIRFARAQAAYSGRRVQIRFATDESGGTASTGPSLFRVGLAWESDPLAFPGVFTDMQSPGWDIAELNRLVGVRHVYLPGTTLSPAIMDDLITSIDLEEVADAGVTIPEPITFAPDGSSDSAHIHLVPRVEDDPRTVTLYLSGLTGAFHHEIKEAETDESTAALEDETFIP